jgi:proline dehydrogenase
VLRRRPSSVSRALAPLLVGRFVAGPRIEDAVRVAAELVADGRLVGVEHHPDPAEAVAELSSLVGELRAAGLGSDCELTVPADMDAADVAGLAGAASAAGLRLAVDRALEVPGATVLVPSAVPGAEGRCRAVAGERVRLVQGRGRAADLAFVRCLNVLMAGSGQHAVAASDPRLIAIAGERAAWYGRTAESWEYVMPYGVLPDEQHRLVAGGYAVRVAVPSGPGAVSVLARRLGGRA